MDTKYKRLISASHVHTVTNNNNDDGLTRPQSKFVT